jgi:hypothetical protein
MAIAKSASSVLQIAPGSEQADKPLSLPVQENPNAEYELIAGEKPYLWQKKRYIDLISKLADSIAITCAA